PLRPGVLRDGEVADVPALAEALKAFFGEHELSTRVRLGIANQRIVVRTLDLPPLEDEKALAAAVKVQAPDHIPMPMDEAIVDWQSLGSVQTPSGPRTRVVVVAVRREMVDRLVAATREAGLKLEGIDLSAFGMVRALAGGSKPEGAVLYVSVGGLTNVAVANASGCLFTRAAAGGLDAMVHTLSERRGLTLEHARQWMTHVGLHAPLEGVDGDTDLVAAARTVLEEGVHQLADTVRNSLNFYRMQESAEQVETGVLTGPAVSIPGFVESLSEQLRLPLEPAVVASQDEDADLGRLTVAAGLAVENIV
ncbi:MAG TPA: pilus assembly protein PilM, partial [Solirubrobacteraceae bacterium]|nr:pilus assembly protein PilM [Solirubrobacteraceae bacterium]